MNNEEYTLVIEAESTSTDAQVSATFSSRDKCGENSDEELFHLLGLDEGSPLPSVPSPNWKELRALKARAYIDNICFPREAFKKALECGGWQAFMVYLYFRINQNGHHHCFVNMLTVCKWLGIKKAMFATMSDLFSKLSDANVVLISPIQYSEKYTLNTLFDIRFAPLSSRSFIYVRHENLHMLNGKTGQMAFAAYCCMESCVHYNPEEQDIKPYERQCKVSQGWIARQLQISRNTAAKCLQYLYLNDYIAIWKMYDHEDGKFFCSIYTLFNYSDHFKSKTVLYKARRVKLNELTAELGYELLVPSTICDILSLKKREMPALLSGRCALTLWDYFNQVTDCDSEEAPQGSKGDVDYSDWYDSLLRHFRMDDRISTTLNGLENNGSMKSIRPRIIPVNTIDFKTMGYIRKYCSEGDKDDFIILNLGSIDEVVRDEANDLFTVIDDSGKTPKNVYPSVQHLRLATL